MTPESVIDETRRWINDFVIGLNLCPFAKKVEESQRIRYAVSLESKGTLLLDEMCREWTLLVGSPREAIETALFICPNAPADFLDFNDLVGTAQDRLAEEGLEGIVQLVGFHPAFRFADTPAEAAENFTNRSPYPMIHLLREESISEVTSDPESGNAITQRNSETLRKIGIARLRRGEFRDKSGLASGDGR